MTNVVVKQSRGISVFGLVYAAIIVGKIFGLLDWSWFWILSPFIFILALLFIAFLIADIIPYVWNTGKAFFKK